MGDLQITLLIKWFISNLRRISRAFEIDSLLALHCDWHGMEWVGASDEFFFFAASCPFWAFSLLRFGAAEGGRHFLLLSSSSFLSFFLTACMDKLAG